MKNQIYQATMATDIYIVTAKGANIGVWDPGAPPPHASLRAIRHAHVIIHHAPLVTTVIQMMTVVAMIMIMIMITVAPHAAPAILRVVVVGARKGCFQAFTKV